MQGRKNNFPWFKYYNNYNLDTSKMENSIYDTLKKSVQKNKDKICTNYYGKTLTYNELLNKIDECANAFINIGVKKGEYVTICLPNTQESLICIYALNKIGAISNLIHPLCSEEEIKKQIKLVDSKYLIIADYILNKTKNIKEELNLRKIIFIPILENQKKVSFIKYGLLFKTKKFKILDQNIISYASFILKSKESINQKEKPKKDDIAIILYSSSMSYNPKGVTLTNENINTLVECEKLLDKDIENRTIITTLPIYTSFGLVYLFHLTLAVGGFLNIIQSLNLKNLDKQIKKYKPNTLLMTPTMLNLIYKSKILKKENMSYINKVICTGEYLSEENKLKYEKFLKKHNVDCGIEVIYGLTETSSKVTYMPQNEKNDSSIGIPIPGTIIKICKVNTEEECKKNEEGEICISSKSVMKFYINNENSTKKVLKRHNDGKIWLHSGDIGYMDKNGFIYFKSKMKRMIISEGQNIYPKQIEEIIKRHPYVENCIIVGVPHPYKKEVVKAYIVLKKNIELTPEVKKSIKEHCEKNIASYALPYAYGYRKELPKNKIGKVAYQELINIYDEEENI